MLHRYIAQYAQECGFSATRDKEKTALKATVLGTGMAGLAATAELAKSGAQVTVCADGPVWGAELQSLLDDDKIDRAVLDNGLNMLKGLGVELLPAGNTKISLQEYNAVVFASKKSLTDFVAPDNFAGVFFTGELVSGPNDAAFSVKKGKEAASRVLAFLKEESK
jgi:heterodisulfide reductase subunit A-like polyferredoxin